MANYKFLSNALIRTGDILRELRSEYKTKAVIKELMSDNRIVKIKNGLYATVNPISGDIFANKYEIATALYESNYVAYHSALEYYGLANQVYSEVQVLSFKRYLPFVYEGLEYRFYLTEYSQGVMQVEQNTLIRITDLERTVIDCIDKIDLAGGLEELISALSGLVHLDENKLIDYLRLYDKKVLYKKAGYLLMPTQAKNLSDGFLKICKENMSDRADDITENKALPQEYIAEWKLIVPKKLINTEN